MQGQFLKSNQEVGAALLWDFTLQWLWPQAMEQELLPLWMSVRYFLQIQALWSNNQHTLQKQQSRDQQYTGIVQQICVILCNTQNHFCNTTDAMRYAKWDEYCCHLLGIKPRVFLPSSHSGQHCLFLPASVAVTTAIKVNL